MAMENPTLRIEICPELAGMICSMIDKATGVDILYKPGPEVDGYPHMRGNHRRQPRQEAAYGGFRSTYHVAAFDAQAGVMVLKANLGGGIQAERGVPFKSRCASPGNHVNLHQP